MVRGPIAHFFYENVVKTIFLRDVKSFKQVRLLTKNAAERPSVPKFFSEGGIVKKLGER